MDILTPNAGRQSPLASIQGYPPGKMTAVATLLKPSLTQSFPTAPETQPIVMALQYWCTSQAQYMFRHV